MVGEQKVKKENKKSTSENAFVRYIKDLKSEFKRITWASKEQVKKSTIIVFIFCLMWAVIVGLLDYGFSNLYNMIFK
jgi:preprotein translocase subunit SecE